MQAYTCEQFNNESFILNNSINAFPKTLEVPRDKICKTSQLKKRKKQNKLCGHDKK